MSVASRLVLRGTKCTERGDPESADVFLAPSYVLSLLKIRISSRNRTIKNIYIYISDIFLVHDDHVHSTTRMAFDICILDYNYLDIHYILGAV